MKRNFKSLREQARKLLFEDAWPEYSNSTWADGDRAGTQFGEPETADPMDPPITPTPQMATQLSTDEPPVDDPEYVPLNSKELAKALAVLAQRLPDDVAEKTFDKFEKYVTDNEKVAVEVIDDAGMESPEEVTDEVVEEARTQIRAALLGQILKEANWGDFKLGRHDDEDLGDEGYYSTYEPPDGSSSFEDIADILPDVSGASGAKQTINRILKKMQTIMKHFPDDLDPIRARARKAFLAGSINAGLFDIEEVEEIGWDDPQWDDLDAFRIFQDEAFILPGHQSLLRDMGKEIRQRISESDLDPSIHEMVYNQAVGNSEASDRKIGLKLQRKNPDMSMEERDIQVLDAGALIEQLVVMYEDLGDLQPGLADRAIASWDKKSQSRQIQMVTDAWNEAYDFQVEG